MRSVTSDTPGRVVDETDLLLLFTAMVAITGGTASALPSEETPSGALDQPVVIPLEPAPVADEAVGAEPAAATTEQRIVEALTVCLGRWGMAKTTVEDIAREAGISRATVYRLFPGGKTAISHAAALADMAQLVELLRTGLDGVDDRADRLSRALWLAACYFADHDVLNYLRAHEPDEFDRMVRLDRLDLLLTIAAEQVGPVLRPVFDTDDDAAAAAVWLGRLVALHVVSPSALLDPTDPARAAALVRTHVLAGFAT
jgi:AcrR family transcriptional regulator